MSPRRTSDRLSASSSPAGRLHRAHLWLEFALKDLRGGGRWTLRQVLYLTLLLGIFAAAVSLPRAIDYSFVRGEELSRYDLRVNGDLSGSVVRRIHELPGVSRVVLAATETPTAVRHKDRSATPNDAWVFDTASEASLVFGDPELVVDGREIRDGVGLDWGLARAIGARVGSKVDLDWIFTAPSVAELGDVRLKGVSVDVIFAPTGLLRSAVVMTRAVKPYQLYPGEDPADPFLYSDAFVTMRGAPDSVVAAVDAGRIGPNLSAQTRSQVLSIAQQEARAALPGGVRQTLTLAFGLGALVVLLREQRARVDRRRGEVAILTAIGARPRWLQFQHAVETILLLMAATALGVIGSRWAVMRWLGVYVPDQIARTTFLSIGALTVALGLWGAVRIGRRLRRIPVSRLLAGEANR